MLVRPGSIVQESKGRQEMIRGELLVVLSAVNAPVRCRLWCTHYYGEATVQPGGRGTEQVDLSSEVVLNKGLFGEI